MLKALLATALTLSALPSFALDAAEEAKIKFCDKRSETNSVQKMLGDYRSSLSFTNQGGMLGGGVCWWHSRFTRNAAYIARFRPDLPKPTDEEAKKIIKAIRKGKAIVEIPGSKDLLEFSYSWGQFILNELEAWQRKDGLLRQQWIRGLSGSTSIKPEAMERRMDELFARIQNGEVVYQKLQLPGVVAHAWLVLSMMPTPTGYTMQVLDSNFGYPTSFTYERGMTSLEYYGYGRFVPYTEQTKEEVRLRRILQSECDLPETEENPENDSPEEDN
jgi:hypothetical protein